MSASLTAPSESDESRDDARVTDPFLDVLHSIDLLAGVAEEAERRADREPDAMRSRHLRLRAERARREAAELRLALLARF
jgi:hypothetical protein